MNFLKFLEIPTKIVVFGVSIFSTFYIVYNVTQPGYELLYLLPLTYGCVFAFFISPILFRKSNLFIGVFSAVSFARYLVLPTLIVYSGWYGGRSLQPPLSSSYDLALKLMCVELIIASIFVFVLFRRLNYRKKRLSGGVELPPNNFFYVFFVIFSLMLLLLNPESLKTFAFIVPSETMKDFGEGSTFSTLTTYCLITSKFIVFLLSMSFFYKKYLLTNSKLYVWISFLITLLNISIMFGDNRSDFIITSIVSLVLFYKLYPRHGKTPIIMGIIGIIVITTFLTAHRNTVTMTGGENAIVDVTDTLQVYLGGPYNVAISTETTELNPDSRTLYNLVYDLLRPAIGIGLLFKNLEGFEFTNYLFNYRIYFSDHVAQIMPMIGQGYFYFGFLFSPILLLSFILLSYFLVKFLHERSRLELIFFLSIPITRLGFAMGQNAGILINDTTFFLLLNMVVYYLNNKIVLTKVKTPRVGESIHRS